jgi:virulence factor Mce-like protein
MGARSRNSIAGNPVLIGAATTLVVIVAVFLAYNANNGLPFVPTYTLKAEVPSAANLVRGNDVRIGGTRVGTVTAISALRHPDGSVTAQLELKLQKSVEPLPVDSTVIVRPRSALGLKYVQLTRGRSAQGFPDGATIPLANATPTPVEIDEVLDTFDDRTRAAARVNLFEFGNALAGRGADLNEAIADLNPLLVHITPILRTLAAPATQLARFFAALDRAAAQVAPVAEIQAQLFDNLDTTFTAFARVARPFLQQSISGGPPALQAGIRSLPVQRPFLLNSQRFFAELRPGVHALRRAAPTLSDALTVGTPALKRTISFDQRLKPTFAALERFAADPLVALGVHDLTNTATILEPTVAFLTPAQTVCNYATLFFRNISSLLSEGDSNGTWQRFIVITTPPGPNNEGGPSSAPANGGGPDNSDFLHTYPYPYTAAPGQPHECEAANEPYAVGRQSIGHVPGDVGTTHDATTASTAPG